MAAQFGDAEPEDAWDPDDPLNELVDNLARRLTILAVIIARPGPLPVAVARRLALITGDLNHIRSRLNAERVE